MRHLGSGKLVRTIALAAVWLAVAAACWAQATPAGSAAPPASRFDVYGGYAYFSPFKGEVHNVAYDPITFGAVFNATGYWTPHFGAQVEGSFHPHGPNDCMSTAQAGIVYRRQYSRFVPFTHLLAGGARLGGPLIQPCTWGYGITAGAGLDYILPIDRLHNRLALRLVQGDFEYDRVNFGPDTAPTFLNGGEGVIDAYRLSAGVVLRFGQVVTPRPAAYGCEAQPVNIFPGDPVTVTGKAIDLDDNKKLTPVYSWSTTGGKIAGTTANATVATAGLAPGDYTVTGRVSEGAKPTQHADCTASFRVHGYEPPTIACSANPTSIPPGGFSTVTAEGRSPQNRTLNYSYSTTAGEITGSGPTATLAAVDVSPGAITITCNVVDDLGKAVSTTASVIVVAPPAPPAPQVRTLCSVSFERDRKRPVRVDNEAKGCLDDIALELNRDSDAILIIVGKHDPQEKPDAAAERTLNIRQYLTQEKGIDPTRLQVRTGETTGRSADNILVPPGATWDPGGTTSFDPTRVTRHGEPYARPR